ncbi:MAG: insulinase family protein [candidate division KSB1 bacterium]|nr:insulinase family protein [candidate division KSB1 bacterium]
MNNMIAIVIILLLMGLTMFTCETTSGIKMVQLPVTNDPTITFRFWFKVGSQNDPVGKEGLAALTARMLTEGATDSNSYEDILKKLYPMAASYNAQVDKEMTVIIGRAHKDNLEAYYKLFKEAILAPAFKQEDFNRLKSQTLNYLERLLRYANDEEFGKQTLNWFIFRGTPYGHPEQGLIESVKSITLEDVKNFYKTYYTRDNLVIGLGGGYPKDLVTRINRDLATLPSGKTVPPEKRYTSAPPG